MATPLREIATTQAVLGVRRQGGDAPARTTRVVLLASTAAPAITRPSRSQRRGRATMPPESQATARQVSLSALVGAVPGS
ncbi:hypothetical protein [Amycolatopsis sp. NPDC051903]|uniref:hypothetical protein n=1 Tax=Amycolatopsis sp. NPDC051903 TaxID=3363936 RepID=UPI003792133A